MTTDINKVALWEIAKALGATYEQSFADDVTRGVIQMPNGIKIFARMDGYNNVGKISFSQSFPQVQVREDGSTNTLSQNMFNNGSPAFDGIKVSATKTPEQIAKDITRRFLPTANELHIKALAYIETQAQYFKDKNEIAVIATEAFKTLGYGEGRKERGFAVDVKYIGQSYVNIEVSSLNAERVQKLAEFLKTL